MNNNDIKKKACQHIYKYSAGMIRNSIDEKVIEEGIDLALAEKDKELEIKLDNKEEEFTTFLEGEISESQKETKRELLSEIEKIITFNVDSDEWEITEEGGKKWEELKNNLNKTMQKEAK
jgi:hypothetical protein